jgi:hypothetical protein
LLFLVWIRDKIENIKTEKISKNSGSPLFSFSLFLLFLFLGGWETPKLGGCRGQISYFCDDISYFCDDISYFCDDISYFCVG